MASYRKAWGLFRSRLSRWASQIRPLPAIFLVVLMTSLVVVTIAPYMRTPGRTWTSPKSWRQSLADSAFVLVFAVILRYEERFRRFFFGKGVSHDWQVRMADLAGIIDRVKKLDLKKTAEVHHLRTQILSCVKSGIVEILDLPPESLSATLVVFANDLTKMTVVARSDSRRNLGREYDSVSGFAPWQAIKTASIVIEDDYREREGIGPRSYRSIAAIPVTRANQAVGCLSIDCTASYAFYGRQTVVLYQVRPYLALLSLTFGPSSLYHECFFEPAHSK